MKNNKKGFTLAELLIVVAIIGVLAAIAIPVYSSQMTKANQAVDEANAGAIKSMAVAQAMLETGSMPEDGWVYFGKKAEGGLTVTKDKPSKADGYNQAAQGVEGAVKVGEGVYQVTVTATFGVDDGTTKTCWITGANA